MHPHAFDVFDMSTHTWTRQQTFSTSNDDTTSIPVHHGLGSSMVYDSHQHIYLFGGWNRRRFDSNLFKLSLKTFCWEIVKLETKMKPTPRYNTEIFIHNDRCTCRPSLYINAYSISTIIIMELSMHCYPFFLY